MDLDQLEAYAKKNTKKVISVSLFEARDQLDCEIDRGRKLENSLRMAERDLKLSQEEAEYAQAKLKGIEQALKTLTAVKYPSCSLPIFADSSSWMHSDQQAEGEPEPEEFLVLKHLYELTQG